MSQQSPVDAATTWVLAFNAKNWDALNAATASDIVYDEVGTQRVIQSGSDYLAASKGWAVAFPDAQATFDQAYASGDTAILEVTWRGTHLGPLQTPTGAIPATNKKIEIRACLIVTVTDQKVRAARHYFDMVTMLTQLGLSAAGV
jgi:steroid delta-isomerase-like uncharacterized protein